MGIKNTIWLCLICYFMAGCSAVIKHSRDGSETEVYAQRSLGTALDDASIVGKIESKLRNTNEHYASMIHVDSYNKIVLLSGRVPDQDFIKEAIQISSLIMGVRQVHSEISQGKPTTISNYWYDTWLTTKVKSQLTWTNNVPSNKVKVRSFAGNIFLMGLMTPAEAKRTIYVASRVPGAKKVISLIETLTPGENQPFVSKASQQPPPNSLEAPAEQTPAPIHSSDDSAADQSNLPGYQIEPMPVESMPFQPMPVQEAVGQSQPADWQ